MVMRVPTMSNPRRANGHRRDQVRRRVLAEEDDCWLCGQPVDKTLRFEEGKHTKRCAAPDCGGCFPHPMSPTVDEVVPVSLGGSPFDRSNCRLAHRLHNIQRGNGTRETPTIEPIETSRNW
jgi:hypothetical protein